MAKQQRAGRLVASTRYLKSALILPEVRTTLRLMRWRIVSLADVNWHRAICKQPIDCKASGSTCLNLQPLDDHPESANAGRSRASVFYRDFPLIQ